jgi:hypothetical protein
MVDKKDFRIVQALYPKILFKIQEFAFLGMPGVSQRMKQRLGKPGKIGIVIEKGAPAVHPIVIEKIEHYMRTYSDDFESDSPWVFAAKTDIGCQVADHFAWQYNAYVAPDTVANKEKPPFLETLPNRDDSRFFGIQFHLPKITELFEELEQRRQRRES